MNEVRTHTQYIESLDDETGLENERGPQTKKPDASIFTVHPAVYALIPSHSPEIRTVFSSRCLSSNQELAMLTNAIPGIWPGPPNHGILLIEQPHVWPESVIHGICGANNKRTHYRFRTSSDCL